MNKNPANFVPLTPISFLHRTADIYGEHQSVLYENRSYTWRESRERCVRIAQSKWLWCHARRHRFSARIQYTRNV